MPLLVDLSNNNPPPIDFHAMRRHGVYGVWMKVSEGRDFHDPTWSARSHIARAAGLRVGGYHFARPQLGAAQHEATFFCSLLAAVERRDLRPVLDLEANDHHLTPSSLYEWCRTFLLTVHRFTGVRCLTYTSPGFVAEQGWRHTFGTGAGLWLAAYGPDDGHEHPVETPAPWRRRVAHQYTSRGSVPGVSGHVDLSSAPTRRRILAHPARGLL